MNETIKRIQNGEKDLLEGLITENLDYIYKYVKKYNGIFLEYEDLKQEAIKEFISSVYAYNFKDDFILNYARRRIYTKVRYFVMMNIDRFKDSEERYAFCVKIYENSKFRLGHNPTIEEFARYYYINESVAYKIFNYLKNPDIKNERFNEENITNNIEEDVILNKLEAKDMKDLVINSCLTKRQKELLLFHYGFYNGETYNFSEMARILNSNRQVYSRANETLLKRVKRIISE